MPFSCRWILCTADQRAVHPEAPCAGKAVSERDTSARADPAARTDSAPGQATGTAAAERSQGIKAGRSDGLASCEQNKAVRQSLIGESQDYIDGYRQGLAEAKDLFSACLDQPAVQQPNTRGQSRRQGQRRGGNR